MKQSAANKYWWIALTAIFVAVVYLSSFIHERIDLTAEKRYSLSPATTRLLKDMNEVVQVQVFLTGDLPADYKKLSLATKELLEEFNSLSANQVRFSFEKPGDGIRNDTVKMALYDSLARLGVVFENNESVSARNEQSTSRLIIPSALVTFGHHKPIAIDLRSSRRIYKQYNVITDQPQEDAEATRNAAEALLEYKFANAIDKLTRKYVPTIAYVVGNGEPIDLTVNDLGESLRNEYRLAVFDLKKGYPDASLIDALVIAKPNKTFTDEDKLKLDQYVMNGGKIIWFIDKLHADLDSLMRSKAEYTAYDRGLDLDDLLFRYGVRVNGDLLQDRNCARIPVVTGYNPNGEPIMTSVPWPYYPLLSARDNNPISKNMDRVLPFFPSSIDTVNAPGIHKTILLSSDTASRRLASPSIVSLNSAKNFYDKIEGQSYNQSYLPVAVLLEGKFRSFFANKGGVSLADSVQRASGRPFLSNAIRGSKQIMVSDADIVTNIVSNRDGPLPMGEQLPPENYRFANREFFLNCIDYLVSRNQLFESRNKDLVLRLLDKRKVEEQRNTWQFLNIVLPIALVVLVGLVYQWRRKKKYGTIFTS